MEWLIAAVIVLLVVIAFLCFLRSVDRTTISLLGENARALRTHNDSLRDVNEAQKNLIATLEDKDAKSLAYITSLEAEVKTQKELIALLKGV